MKTKTTIIHHSSTSLFRHSGFSRHSGLSRISSVRFWSPRRLVPRMTSHVIPAPPTHVIPAKAGIHTNRFRIKCGMTFFILLINLFLTLTPTSIHAQGFNLSLSPPLLQATIKPGKAISQVFTIYNNSSNPVKLTPRIIPFLPEDNQGNPSLKPQSNPPWLSYFSLANSFIRLNKPFTLEANSSDQLVLSIKIPENSPYLDHYATLLVSQDLDPQTKTSISGSIGSNILLSIANQAAPPTVLNITNLKPINTTTIKIGNIYLLDNLSPVEFEAQLDNLGTHQSQIHGLLQIHQGTKVAHIQPLLPMNVLAQSSRQVIASGSGQLKYQPSIGNIGRYEASLNIRSENGSSQDSINLIFLPIKASIGLMLGIILLKSILTFSQK